MKDYNLIQSQTIDWLRFPLIIAVVFIHNPGLPSDYVLPNFNTDGFALCFTVYTKILFSHVLSHVAVPVFFFISGYLFFAKTPIFTKTVYFEKLKKRTKSLALPYIIWNLFPIVVALCIWFVKYIVLDLDIEVLGNRISSFISENGGFRMFWNSKEWGGNVFNWIGAPVLGSGPINYPLWYIRDLIVVVLFSPLVYWGVKHFRLWFLALILLFYLSGIWIPIAGFSATAMFFFSWGGHFSINQQNFIIEFRKIKLPCYIMALLLLFADTYFDGGYTKVGFNLYHIFIIFGLISAFNIVSHFIESDKLKVNRFLTNSVMFVFALHTTIVSDLYNTIAANAFRVLGLPVDGLIKYLTTPFMKVGICVLIYYVVNKFTPRVSKVLTGNR